MPDRYLDFRLCASSYEPLTIFILAPGAFFVLATLVAIMNKFKIGAGKPREDGSTCSKDACASCGSTACGGKMFKIGEE